MSEDKKALRILAVMSSPTIMKRKSDSDRVQKILQLEIEKEWKALCQAVEGLPVRLERCYPPTLNKMDEMLNRAASEGAPYRVLHFSGHGHKGSLLFEDGFLQGVWEDANKLGDIFKDAGVELVILSACYSGVSDPSKGVLSPAELLAETYIPAVIHTNQEIRIDVARVFCEAFFKYISYGKSIRESFEFGQRQLQNDPDIRGAQKTVLELTCPQDLNLQTSDIEPLIVDPVPDQIDSRCFQTPYFFGRKEELAEISLALGSGDNVVVTITGTGGSGKTTLASEVAKCNAWRYTGGLIWCDFIDEVSISPDNLLVAIQDQLAMEIRPPKKREDEIMTRLRKEPCLIVVDNIETVVFAARDKKNPNNNNALALVEMLENMPKSVQVLCTGREPFRSKWEKEIKIIGLDTDSAILLFAEIAEKKGKSIKRMESGLRGICIEDMGKIKDVVESVNNLPLSIYLAASSWSGPPERTLEKLAKDLKESCLNVLKDTSMTGKDAERQSSIEGTIKYSYHMLETEEAKKLFPYLSVFSPVSGFDEQAVKNIMRYEGCDKGLEELHRKSLVERKYIQEGYYRYWLFHPVKEFACNIFCRDDKKRIEEIFCKYYGEVSILLYEKVSTSKDIPTGMIYFEVELDNLKIALDLSVKNRWENEVSKIQEGLYSFYINIYALEELSNLLEKVLAFYKKIKNMENMAVIYLRLGNLAIQQDEDEQAYEYYKQGLYCEEDSKVQRSLKGILHQLGILAMKKGDYSDARGYFERSEYIARREGDDTNLAKTLYQMGNLALLQKRYKEVLFFGRRSLSICRETNDRAGESDIYILVGMLLEDMGKLRWAEKYYNHGKKVRVEIGYLANLPTVYGLLGNLYKKQNLTEMSVHSFGREFFTGYIMNHYKPMYSALASLLCYYKILKKEHFSSLFINAGLEIGEDKARELLEWVFEFFDKYSDENNG